MSSVAHYISVSGYWPEAPPPNLKAWPSTVTRVYVIGHTGSGVVYIGDGRVLARGTAPCLKRLAGMKLEAFLNRAKALGWHLRKDTVANNAPPAMTDVVAEFLG